MAAETLFPLWIGWSRFGLAIDSNALYAFEGPKPETKSQ